MICLLSTNTISCVTIRRHMADGQNYSSLIVNSRKVSTDNKARKKNLRLKVNIRTLCNRSAGVICWRRTRDLYKKYITPGEIMIGSITTGRSKATFMISLFKLNI